MRKGLLAIIAIATIGCAGVAPQSRQRGAEVLGGRI